ncbi:MAG: hypothetical protein AAB091_07390, partial [Elusimicrobiota bacterium]
WNGQFIEEKMPIHSRYSGEGEPTNLVNLSPIQTNNDQNTQHCNGETKGSQGSPGSLLTQTKDQSPTPTLDLFDAQERQLLKDCPTESLEEIKKIKHAFPGSRVVKGKNP